MRPDKVAEVRLLGSSAAVALIDIDDAETIKSVGSRFRLDRRGRTSYAVAASGPKRGTRLHTILMGMPPVEGLTVDHVDGDGLNNRRSNLRWATARQQALNRRPPHGARPCSDV